MTQGNVRHTERCVDRWREGSRVWKSAGPGSAVSVAVNRITVDVPPAAVFASCATVSAMPTGWWVRRRSAMSTRIGRPPGHCSITKHLGRTRSATGESSNTDYVDEVLDAGQVGCVAGVQPGRMGVRGGSDQQVHHTRSRLASGSRDGCRQLAIAGRHCIVDG